MFQPKPQETMKLKFKHTICERDGKLHHNYAYGSDETGSFQKAFTLTVEEELSEKEQSEWADKLTNIMETSFKSVMYDMVGELNKKNKSEQ